MKVLVIPDIHLKTMDVSASCEDHGAGDCGAGGLSYGYSR